MNNFTDVIRALYNYTHIVPTEQDYLNQVNNQDIIYLILYWLNKEYLYNIFVHEEMDLLAISFMNEEDLRYFQLENDETFRRLVQLLAA